MQGEQSLQALRAETMVDGLPRARKFYLVTAWPAVVLHRFWAVIILTLGTLFSSIALLFKVRAGLGSVKVKKKYQRTFLHTAGVQEN